MYERILVPLDGSARAERSIPVAAHIARATNGTVVLVQIATLPFTYSPYLGSATYADEAIEADLSEVERYLNSLANSEPLAGIKTTTKAILGSADSRDPFHCKVIQHRFDRHDQPGQNRHETLDARECCAKNSTL